MLSSWFNGEMPQLTRLSGLIPIPREENWLMRSNDGSRYDRPVIGESLAATVTNPLTYSWISTIGMDFVASRRTQLVEHVATMQRRTVGSRRKKNLTQPINNRDNRRVKYTNTRSLDKLPEDDCAKHNSECDRRCVIIVPLQHNSQTNE